MKKPKILNRKTKTRRKCPVCNSVKLKPLLVQKDGKNEYGFKCLNCGYENMKKYKDFIVRY